jgi:hypothetical protein
MKSLLGALPLIPFAIAESESLKNAKLQKGENLNGRENSK